MSAQDWSSLPADLPVPADDGAADHLRGSELPPVALPATDGSIVRLDQLTGRVVVFAYPRIGRPGEEALGGDAAWNAIPGAPGCTPEACAIRDAHAMLVMRRARVFGLSTQDIADQREAAGRLHLAYPLLSDASLELTGALDLPTFEVDGVALLRRMTLMLRDRRVEDVLYPVFPPDRAADDALRWLAEHRSS